MKKMTTLLLAAAVAVLVVEGSSVRAQSRTPAGNASNGKALFAGKAACYSCHGSMGQGGPGGRLAPKPIPEPIFMNTLRKGKHRPGANPHWSGMPPFSDKFLSDSDLADIYAYLASIPEPPDVKNIPLLNQ